MSRPVANALPPLGPLDDFACRQLDRIGAAGASPGRKSPGMALPRQVAGEEEDAEQGGGEVEVGEEEEMRGRTREPSPVYRGGEYDPARQRGLSVGSSSSGAVAANGQQVATVGGAGGRSRWQTVLLEAGGLGAAVSEESLKSLRYCLQWLLVRHSSCDPHGSKLTVLGNRSTRRHTSTTRSVPCATLSSRSARTPARPRPPLPTPSSPPRRRRTSPRSSTTWSRRSAKSSTS